MFAVGALTLLASCASDGDAEPAVTTIVTSTVPATTEAPTTTTSTPPTTQAPTTTIDPAVALAAEVEADLLEADRLANEALQDPFNDEKEQAALDRRTGFRSATTSSGRLPSYRECNRASER